MIKIGRLSLEYVPAKFREWGARSYRASVVLALGPLLIRWRRA